MTEINPSASSLAASLGSIGSTTEPVRGTSSTLATATRAASSLAGDADASFGSGLAPLNVIPAEFPPEPAPGNLPPERGSLLNLLV